MISHDAELEIEVHYKQEKLENVHVNVDRLGNYYKTI